MGARTLARYACRLAVIVGMLLLVAFPAMAWAQGDDYATTTVPTSPTTVVSPTTVSRGGGTTPSQELPFTGGDVALLTALGLGAAAGGVGLVWFGRRARAHSQA
jgi:hypothetical protein